ncbi:MAG: hypothetical protein HY000_33655 [Planctomycetes bacterium]|nr:hypothetical protein [Planctomycetota bacterium]
MENETLDLGKTPRWRIVDRAIQDDEAPGAIARKVGRCLCKTLKRVSKQLPLPRFFAAAELGDLGALRRLVRDYRQHPYARLFFEVAQGHPARDAVALAEDILRQILWKFLDQIAISSVGAKRIPRFSDCGGLIDEVLNIADPDIRYLARQIAENPGRVPRMPRRRNTEPEQLTEQMLGESLL